MIKDISDVRTNTGFEVQWYDADGNNGHVVRMDTEEELAQYLARCCWGAPRFTQSPTIWKDGEKWCCGEYTEEASDIDWSTVGPRAIFALISELYEKNLSQGKDDSAADRAADEDACELTGLTLSQLGGLYDSPGHDHSEPTPKQDLIVTVAMSGRYRTTIYGECVDTSDIDEVKNAASVMFGDADTGEIECVDWKIQDIRDTDGNFIWEMDV